MVGFGEGGKDSVRILPRPGTFKCGVQPARRAGVDQRGWLVNSSEGEAEMTKGQDDGSPANALR